MRAACEMCGDEINTDIMYCKDCGHCGGVEIKECATCNCDTWADVWLQVGKDVFCEDCSK